MSVPQITLMAKTSLASTDTNVYQLPEDSEASITQICLCNTHTGSVTVNVAITDSTASSSASSDRIFSSMAIGANETMMVMTNMPLTNQDKIWANASVGSVVNLFVSGVVTSTV